MDDEFRKRYVDLSDIIASWLPADFHWQEARLLDFGCGEAITAFSFAVRGMPILIDPRIPLR